MLCVHWQDIWDLRFPSTLKFEECGSPGTSATTRVTIFCHNPDETTTIFKWHIVVTRTHYRTDSICHVCLKVYTDAALDIHFVLNTLHFVLNTLSLIRISILWHGRWKPGIVELEETADEHVSLATDTNSKIEELLEAVFSMWSVSRLNSDSHLEKCVSEVIS
jgi:hypothetical protein